MKALWYVVDRFAPTVLSPLPPFSLHLASQGKLARTHRVLHLAFLLPGPLHAIPLVTAALQPEAPHSLPMPEPTQLASMAPARQSLCQDRTSAS